MSLGSKIQSLEEYKSSMCRNIQSFLAHERLYNFNCVRRLFSPFKVIDFEQTNSAGHMFIRFAQGDKIFIKEADLKRYNNGQRHQAVRLIALSEERTESSVTIEISLKTHNLSNLVVDMPRLHGVIIDYNGTICKTQDVQYEEIAKGRVGNIVKLVLTEYFSAETFLNEKAIMRNKTTHLGNGINFEGIGEQEAYVKFFDATDAVNQERDYVCQEILNWFKEFGASEELLKELNKKIETL